MYFEYFAKHCFLNFLKHLRKKTKIYHFDLESILDSDNGKLIEPIFVSTGEYRVCFEKTFAILFKKKELIGVNFDPNEKFNLLVNEYFSDSDAPRSVGKLKSEISMIVTNKHENFILVADKNGNTTQYKMGNETWCVDKIYRNIGFGCIYSGTVFGHLAVIGGFKKLRLVDLQNRLLIDSPLQTIVGEIYTLQFCIISRSLMLVVGGDSPDYQGPGSDLLDLTNIYKKTKSAGFKLYQVQGLPNPKTSTIRKYTVTAKFKSLYLEHL